MSSELWAPKACSCFNAVGLRLRALDPQQTQLLGSLSIQVSLQHDTNSLSGQWTQDYSCGYYASHLMVLFLSCTLLNPPSTDLTPWSSVGSIFPFFFSIILKLCIHVCFCECVEHRCPKRPEKALCPVDPGSVSRLIWVLGPNPGSS